MVSSELYLGRAGKDICKDCARTQRAMRVNANSCNFYLGAGRAHEK